MSIPKRLVESAASDSLAPTDSVHAVTLVVSNLASSLAFYRDVVGLSVLHRTTALAALGVRNGSTWLLTLEERADVSPVRGQSRLGLFHTAFLLPNRSSLGAFVRHLSRLKVPFGAADHDVSEAIYIVDPDGLTVEVYADRPRGEWHYADGELMITTEPLNLISLAQTGTDAWKGVPKETSIGHLHFYVGDLPRARKLYCEGLGMTLRNKSYPGALFVAAGGYHHHLGLNTWAKGAPPAGVGDARLKSWQLEIDSEQILRTAERMTRAGWTRLKDGPENFFLDDWGITVHLVTREPRPTQI